MNDIDSIMGGSVLLRWPTLQVFQAISESRQIKLCVGQLCWYLGPCQIVGSEFDRAFVYFARIEKK